MPLLVQLKRHKILCAVFHDQKTPDTTLEKAGAGFILEPCTQPEVLIRNGEDVANTQTGITKS